MPSAATLTLVPLTLREANAFVSRHHRHHRAARGCRFCVGARRGTELVAVAIVGRPVARRLDDGTTAEVIRLASIDGPQENGHASGACSKLYAACWRACQAIGYRRIVTYTLTGENGASLRAVGWLRIGEAGGGSWSRDERLREDSHPLERKVRWEMSTKGQR